MPGLNDIKKQAEAANPASPAGRLSAPELPPWGTGQKFFNDFSELVWIRFMLSH
jgi:hypothetical protein